MGRWVALDAPHYCDNARTLKEFGDFRPLFGAIWQCSCGKKHKFLGWHNVASDGPPVPIWKEVA